MSGRIPEDIIEQVRTASDIVSVISQYINLKKRGRNFLALCPFHTEKTPSFSVSPDKQIYHCFGCGKGGNAFSFLMEHENITFAEAVRTLADKAGILIPEKKVDSREKEELDRLYYAHQLALDYYHDVLKSAEYEERMEQYLKTSRGISEESINLFKLGLAGESWEGFFEFALKKGLYPKELIKAGLAGYSETRDKYYDRFRLRLMIPIFNMSGKVIAFGGRALKKGERAKYINSPETPLYNKSFVLYGLNFSRQFIREANEVIIVEGYFDLISLYQAGIKNVVASSGTAFTAQQARLLARFAENAYLFYDADSAGEKAAIRSVDALYDAGMEVMVMIPPEGEDPDSIARQAGMEAIAKIKSEAMRYLDFRMKDIDTEKQGIIAREKLVKEFAELAGRINDNTRREMFIGEAANIMNVNPQTFINLIAVKKSGRTGKAEVKAPRKMADFERDLISLALNFPDYFDIAYENLTPDDFQTPELEGLFALICEQYRIRGNVSVGRLIDDLQDKDLINTVTFLANIEWSSSNISQIMHDYISKLNSFKTERQIDTLKAQLKQAEEKNDSGKAEDLSRQISEMINRRK